MIKIARFIVGFLETNCYVITSDQQEECVIVDAGGGYKAISDYLEKEGKKPVALFCTHGHFDHILDAKKWKDRGVKIYLHKEDLPLFTEEEETFPGRKLKYETTVPDVFMEDGDTFSFGEMVLTVIHTPGHTNGGVCIDLNGQYVFTGDTIFFHSFGRTDLGGGDYGKLIKSVNNILQRKEEILYPGHGEATTITEEKMFNPLFERR